MSRAPKIRCSQTGKRVFSTRERAEAALQRIRANPDPSDPKLPGRCYRCPHCHFWHLTCAPARTPEGSSSLPARPK